MTTMHSFTHFVATRFNLRVWHQNDDVSGIALRSDAWMERRLALFESICVPSMCRQSSPHFVWLVYFDHDTTQKHRRQIDAILSSSCPPGSHFIPRYVISQDHMIQDIRDLFASAAHHREWLLTTRLDSDDALHPFTVDRIQREFLRVACGPKPPPRFAMNLRDGFQFVVNGAAPTHTDQLFTDTLVSNNFMSLAERVGQNDVSTVFCHSHDDYYYRLRDHLPLFQLTDIRAWAMAIHGSNLCTGASNGWPSLDHRSIAAFGPFFEGTRLSRKAYVRNWRRKLVALTVRVIGKLGRLARRGLSSLPSFRP